jgi:hypothetical protein
MKKIIIYSILITLFISCKRYEEGPLISFRSANHRIAGNWRVESFTANGIDSMAYLQRYHLDGLWHFAPYDTYSDPDLKVLKDSLQSYGTWSTSSLDNHNSLAIFLFYVNRIPSSSTSTDTIADWPFRDSWEILRLKENDMKLTNVQNTIEYKIHFKPNS